MFTQLISVSGSVQQRRMMLFDETGRDRESHPSGNLKQLKASRNWEKSAERIILELRTKLGKNSKQIFPLINNTLEQDALNALIALGIARPVAEQAIKKVLVADSAPVKVEDIIKKVLKTL